MLTAADTDGDEPPLLAGADDSPPCELVSLLAETSRAVTFLGQQTWPVRRLVAFKLFKEDVDSLVPGLECDVPLSPIIRPAVERGRIGGRLYAVTPYIAGGTLPQCYDRHRLGLPARITALLTVSDAIAHAHTHGLPHGHLAPTNVLCDPAAPFGVHIIDMECNAGKSGRQTAADLVRDDVTRLIELASLVLHGPMREQSGTNLQWQPLSDARSAADVRAALDELVAQLGA